MQRAEKGLSPCRHPPRLNPPRGRRAGALPSRRSCGSSPSTRQRTTPEARGAVLRREGIYSSHIALWRQKRDSGGKAALDRKRGPKPNPHARELEKLRRQNERLVKRNEQLEKIVEIQGKMQALLQRAREQGDSAAVRAITRETMSALIEAGISQREACRSTGTSRASWNRWQKIAASPAHRHFVSCAAAFNHMR